MTSTLLENRNEIQFTPGKIDPDIHARVSAIMDEMNYTVKGRAGVIHGIWVGRIGGLHVLMRGKGGTGKSMISRTMCEHISDAVRFETALDETSDPSQVFGSPDVPAMAQEGITRRVTTGMLPEATDALLDEFFNGNIPLLHSIMPVLNERLFHNGTEPMRTPLRQALMGTNKYNLDPDLHALFDRVHIRFDVNYISDRDQKRDMVAQAIARLDAVGRGALVNSAVDKTTVTVKELDQAFHESLHLNVPPDVYETFFDLEDELAGMGVEISSRRINDGFNAVLANAWVRGHEDVTIGDLDILSQMFWTHEDQITPVRNLILGHVSPGEAKAIELLETLDTIKKEVHDAKGDDAERARKVSVEAVRNAEVLKNEAEAELEKARALGGSISRLEEVIGKASAFRREVAKDVFGFTDDEIANASA